MRDSEEGGDCSLVQGGQPTQTTLVPRGVSHAEVHHGVVLRVVVEVEFLYQEVEEVRVFQQCEVSRESPGVLSQSLEDTGGRGEEGGPVRTVNYNRKYFVKNNGKIFSNQVR